jgi:hypothetical protein
VTRSAILSVQARAYADRDFALWHSCWHALGIDARSGWSTASKWQIERGIEACGRAMEGAS